MKYDSGHFEGGYRLMHIHRTKRDLFLVQAVLVLVFAAYLVYAGGGFSAKPFYLGIDSFLYFVLIMALLMMVEAYVFTVLEMRFVKSASTKFIITQRAFRSALAWTLVWVVVLMVFALPFVPEAVQDATRSRGELVAGPSDAPGQFELFNTDLFGLTEVSTINVRAQGAVEVFVLTEHNYLLFKDDGMDMLAVYRVNVNDHLAAPELAIDFPDMPRGRFYVLFYSVSGGPVEVEYTIEHEIANSLMDYMPLMAIAFIAVNGVAAGYMLLLNRQNRQGIYR